MSDLVPSESKSEQDTLHTTRSPDPPCNRPSLCQTRSQPSQAGPIHGSTQRDGRQPALGIPPLRGQVAAIAASSRSTELCLMASDSS
ncbi:hypothetical protein PGT21_021269 [Puccinia graminis f. sp. tritici]|uniref:Uncharacterized protein n=1 Tax=Puccinia graminis f. sp. tritici TaxID=56615 RepID=A0A5B0PDX2_PUCGR|nr:hypothetical protein PGTUg99_032820 [Puccinia graminis f. sp. tritici]KAA1099807.1 hypothetical protein PGT21_021269 [Puccinia graminis f. sp. tritici]